MLALLNGTAQSELYVYAVKTEDLRPLSLQFFCNHAFLYIFDTLICLKAIYHSILNATTFVKTGVYLYTAISKKVVLKKHKT